MTKQNEILEKIEAAIYDVYLDIRGLSDEERMELIRKCEMCSTTNCSWAMYRGANLAKNMALEGVAIKKAISNETTP